MKKKLMIFTDWYLPGTKAGGPIKSVSNLVELLCCNYDIYIVTSNRDLNEPNPYPNIESDRWIKYEGYQIFYATPSIYNYIIFKNHILFIKPDYLYLNSMFSIQYAIFPLLVRKFNELQSKYVIAPRGMLRGSALAQKRIKKLVFINIQSIIRLFKDVTFHATDNQESIDIQKYFKSNVLVKTIENIAVLNEGFSKKVKEKHKVTLVFTGRVHPIKGLDFLLSCLKTISGKVNLLIIGPIENISYFDECIKIKESLPDNINISFTGHKSYDEIKTEYNKSHFFILPTQGENFGHAIFEALACGLPVLISDQTPWKNLSLNHAGWDFSLSNKKDFIETIQNMVNMDNDEYQKWSNGAFNYLKRNYDLEKLKLEYKNLFN